MDYSKVIFSQGLVCKNNNNNTYCVIIDGTKGTENDRCSLVLESCGDDGFILHQPPNRALTPTGRIYNLQFLAKAMRQYVAIKEEDK